MKVIQVTNSSRSLLVTDTLTIMLCWFTMAFFLWYFRTIALLVVFVSLTAITAVLFVLADKNEASFPASFHDAIVLPCVIVSIFAFPIALLWMLPRAKFFSRR